MRQHYVPIYITTLHLVYMMCIASSKDIAATYLQKRNSCDGEQVANTLLCIYHQVWTDSISISLGSLRGGFGGKKALAKS